MLTLLAALFAVALVPGTNETYTDGVQTWAGNPFCAETGVLLQPDSPAIDAGVIIPGHHCPAPGTSVGQPRNLEAGWLDTNCHEWYGAAPDAGACEFVPTALLVLSVPEIEVTIEEMV